MRVSFNPVPVVAIGVSSGIGYLADGADGAVLGAVIFGSIVIIGTIAFGFKRK